MFGSAYILFPNFAKTNSCRTLCESKLGLDVSLVRVRKALVLVRRPGETKIDDRESLSEDLIIVAFPAARTTYRIVLTRLKGNPEVAPWAEW